MKLMANWDTGMVVQKLRGVFVRRKSSVAAAMIIRNVAKAADVSRDYSILWTGANDEMTTTLKGRGEKFVPGNAEYDKIVEIIGANRKDRQKYEQDMSGTITYWTADLV